MKGFIYEIRTANGTLVSTGLTKRGAWKDVSVWGYNLRFLWWLTGYRCRHIDIREDTHGR